MTITLDRFTSIMETQFSSYSDEFWGPIYGPGGPRIRERALEAGLELEAGPHPEPWRRELTVAYEAVKLAQALEIASPGGGSSFLSAFSDEPDDWCGTRPPGRPHVAEEALNRDVLGAALRFVAAGVGDQGLAEQTRELGSRMMG